MSVVSEPSGSTEAFLESCIEVCRALASAFLELPAKEGVEGLLALDPAFLEGSASGNELAAFVRSQQGRGIEEVLTELGRDRTAVVRGHGAEECRPPYESLYIGCEPNASIAGLNRFYAEHGFTRTEEVKDASDQIGVEFAFVASLLEKERGALRQGNGDTAAWAASSRQAFVDEHLGRWAHRYAREAYAVAKTGYWRSVALAIDEALAAMEHVRGQGADAGEECATA